MNSLSALLKVCQNLPNDRHVLSAYEAGRFSSQTVNGRSVADVGCEPILHMRHFQVLSSSHRISSSFQFTMLICHPKIFGIVYDMSSDVSAGKPRTASEASSSGLSIIKPDELCHLCWISDRCCCSNGWMSSVCDFVRWWLIIFNSQSLNYAATKNPVIVAWYGNLYPLPFLVNGTNLSQILEF